MGAGSVVFASIIVVLHPRRRVPLCSSCCAYHCAGTKCPCGISAFAFKMLLWHLHQHLLPPQCWWAPGSTGWCFAASSWGSVPAEGAPGTALVPPALGEQLGLGGCWGGLGSTPESDLGMPSCNILPFKYLHEMWCFDGLGIGFYWHC